MPLYSAAVFYSTGRFSLLGVPQFAAALLLPGVLLHGAPAPAGLWDFDDPQELAKATVGADLGLVGQHTAIAGPETGNAAVRIGPGSYYVCTHGLVPIGSDSFVNRYSLLIDFRIGAIGPWHCFFQTNPENGNDGDCFIRANDGAIGVGQTGYSATPCTAGIWQRFLVCVDNSLGVYQIYLDGERILDGSAQAMDGRFSLDPILLLFADENGEDATIDVARVAIYDLCLSAADAAELGGVAGTDPTNHAPAIVPGAAGPTQMSTGQAERFQFAATDDDSDAVRVRVDWGDGGSLSAWSNLVTPSQSVAFTHAYSRPGTYQLRALAQDARGLVGDWAFVQSVTVSGAAQVEFLTSPYLQNVRPDAIAILWELDAAVDAQVEYGLDEGYGLQATATHEPSGAGTEIYRCTLRNLSPGTRYHFRTRPDGQPGPGGTFTTAPGGPVDFSFTVWADSQGSNHGAYAPDPLEPTKAMLRHMAASGIQFAVTAGDLAENGGSYADTRQYYLDRVAALLGPTVPWFVAWGNHDAGADTVIRKFADLPSQERSGFTTGYGSYSFDYAGCHFVCIDYASSWKDIVTWLEGDLQSTANRNARFTFLFVHVPPYCELWIDGDESLRTTLVPMMEAYGVDVCFSGHTHEYSRGFLNGIHYCVTGGGSWLDFPEVLVWDWPHMTVGGYHEIPGVVKPGLDRGGGLVNEYVRVDVHGDSFTASMVGFAPDGTELGVLDQFTLSVDPAAQPPETPTITGPAEIDAFESAQLELHSSAFVDLDPGQSHSQSVWRLCRTSQVEAPDSLVVQGITSPGVLAWSVPTSNLWPGQTLYASVQHIASGGQASSFAPPVAIQIRPDPLYVEDFEGTSEFSLPAGWTATYHTSVDVNAWDPENPKSNTYLTWTVVSADRLGRVLGSNRVNVPAVLQGNSAYAESDHRSGVQLQYLSTSDIDLRAATSVHVVFRSNYLQNQDSLGALEYSVDAGTTWLPVLYLLDEQDVVRAGGTGLVDAEATFTRVDSSGVPTADGSAATGGTYGEHILSRPFSGLGAYVQGRVNDDPAESKRIERCRLTAADGQGTVRFRFTLIGTASWFWGIDDFSLYGTVPAAEPLQIVGMTFTEGALRLEWTGPAGPFQIQHGATLEGGGWQDVGLAIDAAQRSVVLPIEGELGFYRIRLAR